MASFPSSASAFGVWRMLDVRDAIMGYNWPNSTPASTTLVGNGVTFSGGTATASSYIDVRTPSAAFDGYTNDETQCWHSSSFGGSQWLQYDFGATTTKVITAYWLMPRPDMTWYPKTWTFAGSNDGTNFTTLDTQTSQTMPTPNAGITNTQNQNFAKYTISNTNYFRYYRITVTQVNGGSAYCVIGEMALIGY